MTPHPLAVEWARLQREEAEARERVNAAQHALDVIRTRQSDIGKQLNEKVAVTRQTVIFPLSEVSVVMCDYSKGISIVTLEGA